VDLVYHGANQFWDPRNPQPSKTWGNQIIFSATGSEDAGNLAEFIESLAAGGYGAYKSKRIWDAWQATREVNRLQGELKAANGDWNNFRLVAKNHPKGSPERAAAEEAAAAALRDKIRIDQAIRAAGGKP
jgi:hypothetical protein